MAAKPKPKPKGKPKRKPLTRRLAFDARRQAIVLEALAEGYSLKTASTRAGVTRITVWSHRQKDAEFAAAYDEAIEAGTDVLEDEALRRGAQGWDEPVFYKGVVCGEVRKYSDTMLAMQLNARRPEKYRQRHEHTGKDGGPLQVQDVTDLEFARRLAFALAQGAKAAEDGSA